MAGVWCGGCRAASPLLLFAVFLTTISTNHYSVVEAACNAGTQFTCTYDGKCIDTAQQFNGVNDCIDNSDEISTPCDKVNHFKCAEGVRGVEGACLPITYVLDGDADCSNANDESKIVGGFCNTSWCCPCNQFISNSFCDTTLPSHQCQCTNGHYANSILNNCIARVLYDPCSTDTDCVTVANSTCSSSQCLCVVGRYGQNGTCVERVIGDLCSVDIDCSAVVTHSGCVSASCACDDGYYVTNNNTVCTARVLGDNCTKDTDCSGAMAGSICQNGVCACHPDRFEYTNQTGCWHKYLGDACSRDGVCSIDIPNAYCKSSVCNCSVGWIWKKPGNNDVCRERQVGVDPCDSTADCGITNAQCVGSVCVCNTGYKTNTALTTCTQIVVGDPCVTDTYCANGYAGGYCDTINGICGCTSGYLVTSTNVCRVRVLGVDSCTTDEDCSGGVPNSECVNNVCTCIGGYYISPISNTVCLSQLTTTTCSVSDSSANSTCSQFPDSVCVAGYCACPVGYMQNTLNCTRRQVGDSCSVTSQCSYAVSSSWCNTTSGKCQCLQGYIVGNTTTCRRRILQTDSCSTDSDCSPGIANSLCASNNTCICGPGYETTPDYTFCIDTGASTAEECTDFASCQPWAIALIIVALLLPPLVTGVVMITYKNIQDKKGRLLKTKREKYGRGDPYRDLGMAAIPTITNFTAPHDTALHTLPEIGAEWSLDNDDTYFTSTPKGAAGLVIRDKSFFRDITSITSKVGSKDDLLSNDILSKVDI